MSDVTSTDTRELLARIEQLEARLDEYQARAEIVDCLNRYGLGLDRRDPEMVASVYHDDAEIQYGVDLFKGTATEAIPWLMDIMKERWEDHTHHLTVMSIEIDGDVAHTDTYNWFAMRQVGGETIDTGSGHYIDRLERRNGEWRIANRRFHFSTQGLLDANPERL